MRGRTLSNSYIILDEAQNTTPPNENVFNRLERPKNGVTGDLTQAFTIGNGIARLR